jgi:hypothetical protein
VYGLSQRRAIWANLSSAPARLTRSPSSSPSQPSLSAPTTRAVRLSRISASRARWVGSGRRSEHLTQTSGTSERSQLLRWASQLRVPMTMVGNIVHHDRQHDSENGGGSRGRAAARLPLLRMTHTGIETTAELVRDLLRDQHPDLAGLPLKLGARGWDNQLWRLGDDLAVRLPWATQPADALLRKEHAWLPALPPPPHLPLPVPVPQRLGEPSERFPRPGSSPPGCRASPLTAPPPRAPRRRPTPWPHS